MLIAFADHKGGFYQTEAKDEFDIPPWAHGMTKLTEQERLEKINPGSSVPTVVSMRQARLALLQANKLQDVEVAINSMQGAAGDAARIEWGFSNEVRRNQPLTLTLAQAIGMTESEMDQLFITAATL